MVSIIVSQYNKCSLITGNSPVIRTTEIGKKTLPVGYGWNPNHFSCHWGQFGCFRFTVPWTPWRWSKNGASRNQCSNITGLMLLELKKIHVFTQQKCPIFLDSFIPTKVLSESWRDLGRPKIHRSKTLYQNPPQGPLALLTVLRWSRTPLVNNSKPQGSTEKVNHFSGLF